jgi:MscS family membrane protein
VVASLGVSGFAFALAARPTLENLIAGVTLYLDRPVRIGDFCRFGDVVGSVEEVGLRSTRIRQLEGSLISVPNSRFADFQLINFSNSNHILFRGNFGLRLDTGVDQLCVVLAKLREVLYSHPMVKLPRVRLVGFTEHSLKIQMIARVDTVVRSEYHAVREDIYLRTLKIIEEAGTRLAVPVRITYLARDGGLDKELIAAAEEEVKVWREAGEFPFPDMSEQQREALQHTLDYPPKGSVNQEPIEKLVPEPEKN